jgi:hypothetical protein
MAPRSQLEITTSSVIRLVKEEASYHKELADQIERVKRLEAETAGDDENREYMLKQEVCPAGVGVCDSSIDVIHSTWPSKRPERSFLV